MSKLSQKEFELISAYIDNELSLEESERIKEKISSDKEYKEKYEELKKIKLLTSSIEPIAPSPYFETKFDPNIKSGFAANFKKYAPVYGLVTITLFLMILMKFNPSSVKDMIQNQTANVLDFYTANLRPLFASNEISKEDVFNFALYQKLPIDKDNSQFLQLGFDNDGNEFFEIKTADSIFNSNNLENFVSSLNLNPVQKNQMDSILNFYAKELESKVLVNDKNTLAINSGLWNYNKAIAAEIIAFASAANKTALASVLPSQYHINYEPNVVKAIDVVKSKNNDFVFINPDTVFTMNFEFDFNDLKEEKNKVKGKNNSNINTNISVNTKGDSSIFKVWVKNKEKDVHFFANDKTFKVVVPDVNTNFSFDIPNMDSIMLIVEKATSHIKNFHVVNAPNIPNVPNVTHVPHLNYNYYYSTDNSENKNKLKNYLKLNIDSLTKVTMESIDFNNISTNEIDLFADSLVNNIILPNFSNMDSLVFNSKEFEKRMKTFEIQMKQFEKNLKEELKKKTQDQQKKKKSTTVNE